MAEPRPLRMVGARGQRERGSARGCGRARWPQQRPGAGLRRHPPQADLPPRTGSLRSQPLWRAHPALRAECRAQHGLRRGLHHDRPAARQLRRGVPLGTGRRALDPHDVEVCPSSGVHAVDRAGGRRVLGQRAHRHLAEALRYLRPRRSHRPEAQEPRSRHHRPRARRLRPDTQAPAPERSRSRSAHRTHGAPPRSAPAPPGAGEGMLAARRTHRPSHG